MSVPLPFQDPILHSYVPFRGAVTETFSGFWRAWRFWQLLLRHFTDCPLAETCLVSSHDFAGVMCVGEETTEVDCHSHHIISQAGAIHMAYWLMLTLITWPRSCLSGFSTAKPLSSPTSPRCPLARNYFGQLTPEGWGVGSSSLKAEYLHKWCEIHLHGRGDCPSPFLYALNHCFKGVWIYVCLLYIANYNPILLWSI